MLFDKLFHDYIGRVVAFAVAPAMAVVSPFVIQTANDVLGVNLTNAQLDHVTIAVIIGVAGVAYKWLHNLGAYERVQVELEKLYDAGNELVPVPVDAPVDAPADVPGVNAPGVGPLG